MTGRLPSLPASDLEHVLRFTRELWPAAKGKSFFITGGTGFFGTWLVESFVHANETLGLNARAVVLSRNPTAFRQRAPQLAERPDLAFIQGDIRNFPFVEGDFDYLIHAATDMTDRGSHAAAARQTAEIPEGIQRVIELAASARTGHLLFVSSGAAYGSQPAAVARLPETYPGTAESGSPQAAYGAGKLVAEKLLAQAAITHHFQLKIARCFSFVGPHLDADRYAIGNFIRDAMAGQPVRIHGDGTPQRSYLYAADLAIWLWTILFRGAGSRIYNVGSDSAITIRDCARAVVDAVNPALAVVLAQSASAAAPVERYVPDTGRARTELGVREHIALPEAIQRTVAWLRTSPPKP